MSVSKKKGRTYFDYDFQIAGQRFQGSTGCASRREAEQVERKKRVEAAAALAAGRIDPKQMTIDDVFARYWDEHMHKLPSALNYAGSIEFIVEAVGRDKLYSQVGNDDVLRFIKFRRERGRCVWKHVGGVRVRTYDSDGKRQFVRQGGRRQAIKIGELSDGSLLNDLNIWRAAHNMARDLWEITVRPIAWRKLRPDAPEKRIVAIPKSEAERLAAQLPRHIMLAAMFTLLTGCRFGQMAGIQNRHIDWLAGTVAVKRQKRKTRNGAWVAEIKQMNTPARECLRLAVQDMSSIDPDAYVFNLLNFRREWVKARTAAGLEKFRFHDLRHVIATWLIKQGTPIQVVSQLLGHSDIRITMRYAEVDGSDVRRALDALPQLMLPGLTVPALNINTDADGVTAPSPKKVRTLRKRAT
jgi:integrase